MFFILLGAAIFSVSVSSYYAIQTGQPAIASRATIWVPVLVLELFRAWRRSRRQTAQQPVEILPTPADSQASGSVVGRTRRWLDALPWLLAGGIVTLASTIAFAVASLAFIAAIDR
jgi:hypothetical protein